MFKNPYQKYQKYQKPQKPKPIGYYYEDEPSNKCNVCGKFLSKKAPVCFACPMDDFKPEEDDNEPIIKRL